MIRIASPRLRAGLTLGVGLGVTVGLLHFHLGWLLNAIPIVIGVLTYLGWEGYKRSKTDSLLEVANKLADLVEKQWKAEENLWKIQDPRPLKVSWRGVDPDLEVDKDLVEKWSRVIDCVDRSPQYWRHSGAGRARKPTELDGSGITELVRVLNLVPTRRLLVLGKPGAGKTILLGQLTLDLLTRRQRSSGDPVPVLLSLASWNPRGLPKEKDEQDGQDFPTWLIDQLTATYTELAKPAPPETGNINQAQALLDKQLILPILDGLDELPESVHARALHWINSWLKPGAGLIVSCRTDNYRNAVNSPRNQPLLGTAGVKVRDLDPEEVSDYLQYNARGADRWNSVLEQLLDTKPKTAVGQALRTPLMVSLARTIYNSPREDAESPQEPAELCDKTRFPDDHPETVEQYLFDAFIKTAYGPEAEKPGHKLYKCSAAKAKKWLNYLATHLDYLANHLEKLSPETHLEDHPKETADGYKGTVDEHNPNFAWWQLRYSAPLHLSGLAVGIVSGIATGLTAGFGENVGAGIGIGLGLGLLLGLAVRGSVRRIWNVKTNPPKLASSQVTGSRNYSSGALTSRLRRIIRSIEAVQGLVGGLLGGLVGGFVAGPVSLIVIGHGRGLASGLPIGLGVGMGIGPASGFWDGLFGGLVGGFGGGLVGTLGVGVGLAAGLLNGTGVGLTAGLSVDRFTIGRREPARGVSWDGTGLAGGIVVGGTVGVTAWVVAGPTIGIVAGLIASIVAATAIGLFDSSPTKPELTTAGPRPVLARDRRTFLIFGIATALATGPIGGLTVALVSATEKKVEPSPAFLLANGWGIALATSLVLGLSFAFAKSSWGSFTLARCWLALHHCLPWRLMAFLADARQRGVLRQVGTFYQFRHLNLQIYLAADPTTTPTNQAKPSRVSG